MSNHLLTAATSGGGDRGCGRSLEKADGRHDANVDDEAKNARFAEREAAIAENLRAVFDVIAREPMPREIRALLDEMARKENQ
jgi:hypothetical protein